MKLHRLRALAAVAETGSILECVARAACHAVPAHVISLVTRERHTLPGSAARLRDAITDALRDYDPDRPLGLKP